MSHSGILINSTLFNIQTIFNSAGTLPLEVESLRLKNNSNSVHFNIVFDETYVNSRILLHHDTDSMSSMIPIDDTLDGLALLSKLDTRIQFDVGGVSQLFVDEDSITTLNEMTIKTTSNALTIESGQDFVLNCDAFRPEEDNTVSFGNTAPLYFKDIIISNSISDGDSRVSMTELNTMMDLSTSDLFSRIFTRNATIPSSETTIDVDADPNS
jgi:hypothetical protein